MASVENSSSLLNSIFEKTPSMLSRILLDTNGHISSKDDHPLTMEEKANSWVMGTWPIILVSFFLVICIVGTGYNALMHLQNYTKPRLQNHVLRIIVVSPIYCTGAFLSFVYPKGDMVVSA